MSEHGSSGTDRGLGLGLLFGALALVGAGAMVVSGGEELAAWGFGAAVLFGCLAVVALHVY